MGDLIHIRIDEAVRKEIAVVIKKSGLYSSESEFVRDAIRKNIDFTTKAIALKALMHSIRPDTYEVDNKTASELFREFGLKP